MKSPYNPHPGALPSKLLAFFRANPDEELTRSDIAEKFDVVAKNVDGVLASAMAAQMIVKRNCADLGMVVFAAGPSLNNAAAPKATTDASAAPDGTQGFRRRLPRVDIRNVKVRYDVPAPDANGSLKGANLYADLLKQLDKDGASFELPIMYRASLQKAASKYIKDHNLSFKFLVRTINATTVGVWRVK